MSFILRSIQNHLLLLEILKFGDNSGFVGWLASHLKQKLGTGVFVTCGQNSNRGGIFDYWGCPAELGPSAIEEVKKLISNK